MVDTVADHRDDLSLGLDLVPAMGTGPRRRRDGVLEPLRGEQQPAVAAVQVEATALSSTHTSEF